MREDFIDIVAFTAHKGLLAAQGLGGLVLSQTIADKMIPLISGGTGSHSHSEDVPAELPDRLEAGTLNLPGITALSSALDYIGAIGIKAIFQREMELVRRLSDGVKDIPGIRIAGTENLADKCAVVALDFPDHDSAVIANRLDEEYGIMTRCGLHCAPQAHKALGTFPRGLLRCSVGHKNTEEEVDILITALRKIIA
ncbi:MAG: aminotransferase class V-fold PLP-dependent enzyme, partial [Treponema sp.]|jgi:selenocysteine lyase/cysteine desulfurase|nr:aminotransferase class V-fold PLP-dependent enzyme [Treponema sp.]